MQRSPSLPSAFSRGLSVALGWLPPAVSLEPLCCSSHLFHFVLIWEWVEVPSSWFQHDIVLSLQQAGQAPRRV